ncbi:MAG: hypothetical protein QXT19_00855 [Candidatus Woesearchaeota archaeon]
MKKAQIKMFETIGVLVIFFFLLVSGAVFYFKMQESAFQKELAKQAQLRSLKAAQRAVFLPELDCSLVSVQRENCFDSIKLSALRALIEGDQHVYDEYFSTFGYSNISVRQVYPPNDFAMTLYHHPPDEYRRALQSKLPVLLYDPVSRDYAFGLMEVTTYAQA